MNTEAVPVAEAQSPLRKHLARRTTLRRRFVGTAVAIFFALAAMPVLTDNRYYLVLAALTLVWMGVALSWNLFSGLTGYISFGHAAFFGLGAYASAVTADRLGSGLAVNLCVGMVVAAALATLIGALSLRLQGHYFAIATLAMAEATRVVITLMGDLTGGTFGLGLPVSYQSVSPGVKYWVVLGALGAAVAVSVVTLWSPLGSRLLSIREDEVAVAALGVDSRPYKVSAFVLSGALTGLFGGLAAWIHGFLTPEAVLSPVINLEIIIMVIVGGMGTIAGPVIGAAVFYLVSERILVAVPSGHLVVLGAVLILTMLFMRDGIMGAIARTKLWPEGFRA